MGYVTMNGLTLTKNGSWNWKMRMQTLSPTSQCLWLWHITPLRLLTKLVPLVAYGLGSPGVEDESNGTISEWVMGYNPIQY